MLRYKDKISAQCKKLVLYHVENGGPAFRCHSKFACAAITFRVIVITGKIYNTIDFTLGGFHGHANFGNQCHQVQSIWDVEKQKFVINWENHNCEDLFVVTTYTCLVLAPISKRKKNIKEINQILFSFVWGSARNPLQRKRLCQSLESNGLEMIDLRSYLNSLKLNWIRRFVSGKNRTWHLIAPEMLRSNFVWNYGVASLKVVMKELNNPFWKDVISAWITFSNAFEIPESMIIHENIFNSEFTKFKVNRYSRWVRSGVRFIGDLFEGNRLMTWERFKQAYKIPCNYLEYMGLVLSLPKQLQKNQPRVVGRGRNAQKTCRSAFEC